MSVAARGTPSSRRVHGVKSDGGSASGAAVSPTSAAAARQPSAGHRHNSAEGGLLALLTRERDRQAVREALPAEVVVHFAARPAELGPPWRNGPPTAILVELQGRVDSALERALEAVQRAAPTIAVWSYIQMDRDVIREAVRLAARRLVVDAITPEEDIGARLKELLRQGYARSETAALRKIWREWMGPETHHILAACIEASVGEATVKDVARELNKSPRALERLVSRSGLPSVHRMVSLCRLLRAMYRLDQPEANVKTVASELGYSSPRSLAKQLHRHTGLTISGLRAGSGFARLAAFVQAELFSIRARSGVPTHGVASGRQRRKVGPR